ncbi:hypothetical protein GH714_004939 [Hevea brasiliensis]|uniref:Uncharacterized protein n=1 Tax=Hevea brasiliensis TaxID=3981 RepID=A0A6A6LA73_HEVBR|nr:hypothetical protein GH714_004939 [Hevea brasiliensis]
MTNPSHEYSKERKDELAVSEFSGNGAGILAAANTIVSTFILVFVAEWVHEIFYLHSNGTYLFELSKCTHCLLKHLSMISDTNSFSLSALEGGKGKFERALAAASSPDGVIGGALAGRGFATLTAVFGGSLLGTFLSEKDMDPVSQRAVEEAVESHAPPRAEAESREELAPPAPETPAQPRFALFQQMTEFYKHIIGAMPPPQPQSQPPPPPQKSHLEKIRKYGAVDFLGKKEDDPMVAKN